MEAVVTVDEAKATDPTASSTAFVAVPTESLPGPHFDSESVAEETHSHKAAHLPVIDDNFLRVLRSSCVEMALNRIDGKEDLYVGG
jgi:hypothetical protein